MWMKERPELSELPAKPSPAMLNTSWAAGLRIRMWYTATQHLLGALQGGACRELDARHDIGLVLFGHEASRQPGEEKHAQHH